MKNCIPFYLLAWCFLLWPAQLLAASAAVTHFTAAVTPRKARVELQITARPNYSVFTLSNPERVVLDIKDIQWRTSPMPAITQGFITKARVSSHADYLRLVFDLKQKAHPTVQISPDHSKYRLVLELVPVATAMVTTHTENLLPLPPMHSSYAAAAGLQQQPKQSENKPSLVALPLPVPVPVRAPVTTVATRSATPPSSSSSPSSAATSSKPAPLKLASLKPAKLAQAPAAVPVAQPIFTAQPIQLAKVTRAKMVSQPPSQQPLKATPSVAVAQPIMVSEPQAKSKARPIIIVIDPGHGGKDPGTTGPHGTREKDVVLAIARDLQRLINNEPGFHAVLTRNSDYYIPLRGRLAIARKDKADMFIAIHADAYINSQAMGASVFALSERGATSEAARWLAEKENSSELLGGANLPSQDNLLRSVLIDLSQTNTIDESLQIGGNVLQQLSKVTLLHHDRVEQAAFVVLKSPDIPSLLVETGFLSSPVQEAQLSNPKYQEKLAYAMLSGVKGYFIRNPPPGTLLASGRNSLNVL